MGGASPYSARFVGLPPCGSGQSQPGESGAAPLGDVADKYCGLVNLSNTCYVNSVLQALYYCYPFRKFAIQHLNEEKEDPSNGESLLNSLAELFAQIHSQRRTNSYVTPRRFLARLRKANDLFDTSEHQDAHEFMQFLLNDIAENLKKRAQRQRERNKLRQQQQQIQQQPVAAEGGSSSSTSGPGAVGAGGSGGPDQQEEDPRTWIHELFQGYLVNQMKCLCCENVSVRRETFLDLSVDIERRTSLAACLRAFESTELLRAGNKFFCDRCGCLQEAEKRLRIYQLPSVLTLHLKRFKYVERLGRCCRLPYRVVFPLQLRVVEHRPPRRNDSSGSVSNLSQTDSRSRPTDTQANGVAHDPGEEPASAEEPATRLYELRSVVVHIGRDPSRGHYVTIVRHGDRCVLLDDDVVRPVNTEVLRSFYGTAGGDPPERPLSHERLSPSRANGQGSSGNGWGVPDGGQDRYSQSAPMYERSPEGTCCGYLLFYEAVDGGSSCDHEAGSVIDVGDAADWISEERDLGDSDSGGSTAEGHHEQGVQDRPNLNPCDEGELTQAFEQRCLPRGPTVKSRPGSVSPLNRANASNPQAAAVVEQEATTPQHPGGLMGGNAWVSPGATGIDGAQENGVRPGAAGSPAGAAAGFSTVCTPGSVVVPPQVAPIDTVSLSRVNVVTVPAAGSGAGASAPGGAGVVSVGAIPEAQMREVRRNC